MVLAFQASAFDRSAICPLPATPRTRGPQGGRMIAIVPLFRLGYVRPFGIAKGRRRVEAGLFLATRTLGSVERRDLERISRIRRLQAGRRLEGRQLQGANVIL